MALAGMTEHCGGGHPLMGGGVALQAPAQSNVPGAVWPHAFAADVHGVPKFTVQIVTAQAPDLPLLSLMVMVLGPCVPYVKTMGVPLPPAGAPPPLFHVYPGTPLEPVADTGRPTR